jgi:beta-phosphoglucomutase family hydrolase
VSRIVTDLDLSRYDAVLFDLDGVLTDTASLHAAAWKRMFDEFLRRWASDHGHPFVPFRIDPDYLTYVDGKPRFEGVASFLESRRIVLPEGEPSDSPDADTIHGLGNRKNELVNRLIEKEGVTSFEGSVRFVEQVREAGLRTAIVSSSKNAGAILEAANLADLFEDRVDGLVAEELGLPGKPAPDTFLEAARRLEVAPSRTVVIEDAIVGVEAGRLGGFGFVIGVDRGGDGDRLVEHGADIVVSDLGELVSG